MVILQNQSQQTTRATLFTYHANSLQVCEEIFEKKCQITFNQEARNETVKMCHRPMEIRCDGSASNSAKDDEDICRERDKAKTEY